MTDTTPVNGFLVVRKPEWSYDIDDKYVGIPDTAMLLDDVFYGGLHRLPWFDIEEAEISGSAPDRVRHLQHLIEEASRDWLGPPLCYNLSDALELLSFANSNHDRNEIIGIRNTMFGDIKGWIQCPNDQLIWLGRDVITYGGFSLLEAGPFSAPEAFSDWRERINQHGLLNDDDDVAWLIERYAVAEQSEQVEPLCGKDDLPILPVEIARISSSLES